MERRWRERGVGDEGLVDRECEVWCFKRSFVWWGMYVFFIGDGVEVVDWGVGEGGLDVVGDEVVWGEVWVEEVVEEV